jgi:hypothetical protein
VDEQPVLGLAKPREAFLACRVSRWRGLRRLFADGRGSPNRHAGERDGGERKQERAPHFSTPRKVFRKSAALRAATAADSPTST